MNRQKDTQSLQMLSFHASLCAAGSVATFKDKTKRGLTHGTEIQTEGRGM